MVRSLGWARAAALMGVTAEASSTAPTSPARSRRFHGARLRYSRNTCSESWWAALVTRSTVAGAAVAEADDVGHPAPHVLHVERLAQHDAMVVLDPGRHVFRVRVARHQGDPSLQRRPAV